MSEASKPERPVEERPGGAGVTSPADPPDESAPTDAAPSPTIEEVDPPDTAVAEDAAVLASEEADAVGDTDAEPVSEPQEAAEAGGDEPGESAEGGEETGEAEGPAEEGAEAEAREAEGGEAEGGEAEGAEAEGPDADGGEAEGEEAEGARPTRRKTPRREKRPVAKAQRQALTAEQRQEARDAAKRRLLQGAGRDAVQAECALDQILAGLSLVYLARFQRVATGGMDFRALVQVRDAWQQFLAEEERRVELREILRHHGAFDEKTEQRLARANHVAAMEDVAAAHLPVVAGRATVARGLGLEALAQAIQNAEPGTELSELARPFVKESDGPTGLDAAIGGARDILAEEMSLDAELRARVRKVFRREAIVSVGLRAERKGDPGRFKNLVGYVAPAHSVPPLRFLDVRRGEKERVLVTTIEPPDELVLPLLYKSAGREDHPHAGFLRAAIEDGYRRILKPLFQAEVRQHLKDLADAAAMETFERNLRHLLLGPVGGRRPVLGLRPDVSAGHRWTAVDAQGLPTGSGTLPHEGTAGREPCVAELQDVLKTYEIDAVAVGGGAGRAAALSLAQEAARAAPRPVDVAVVPDGGTHALEAQGKLEVADRPEVPPECRGALSLARRFQDPLAELVTIDPKALALGPHLHDVHQGNLRRVLEETVEFCVGHVGVDPNVASEELIARMPGFHRHAARGFVAWRDAHGPLVHRAALAAVPGVGPEVAEQAVGFLKLPQAEDPRDRTQLHPRQYDIVEKMAQQVDAPVEALFADGALRSRIRLAELESEEAPLPLLKYVLYQITAGHLDDRPRFARPIPPPEGLTLATLQPGLVLEGRVVRALPFGIFVDVGLETDALIPTPHIGSHPGIDPATVAPVGSVIQARVLDVDPAKKRLTLTMRPDRALFSGPRGRGGGRGPAGRGRPFGERDRGSSGPRREGQPAGRGDAPRGEGRGDSRRPQGRGDDRRRRPPRREGKYGGGTGGIGDIFSGRHHDDRGAPRRISLSPDEGAGKETQDERTLSEEELLARKLAELKRKFEGDR